jgi:lysophospholipase L1-like esterase
VKTVIKKLKEDGNSRVGNPSVGNPGVGNPSVGNPSVGNPSVGNPGVGNPGVGKFIKASSSAYLLLEKLCDLCVEKHLNISMPLRKSIIKNFLPLVFVALLVSACQHKDISIMTDEEPIPNIVNARFLALGDSYTIGHAVDTTERWPVQLADSLIMTGIDITEPEIIAQTGWTTGELKDAIISVNPQGPYPLVTLLIGVNNQYRGLDSAAYREEFRELLQMAISFAGDNKDRVIVISIPDYGVTPFGANNDPEKIAKEIDEFNAINLEETSVAKVKYIDVTPISRLAEEDPELIAEDGLHPSGKMYAEWVKLIYPVAAEILEIQLNQD